MEKQTFILILYGILLFITIQIINVILATLTELIIGQQLPIEFKGTVGLIAGIIGVIWFFIKLHKEEG